MPMLRIASQIDLHEPQLVVAISGWVDGGLVATKVGEHLSGLGQIVATFAPDDIYDYGSNRPTVEFADGALAEIHWPGLSVSAVRHGDHDLLVLTGTEPNTRWEAACHEIAALAEAVGVRRIFSIGAVPAAVAHTRATPIMTTSTDPTVEAFGLPVGRFSVPGAFVNVVSHRVATSNGIPEVGLWAQVPHYVPGVYWPAVEALMTRLFPFLGIDTGVTEVARHAHQQRQRLDQAVADRPDAQELVRRLEATTPAFGLEEDVNLTEEIEAFLRDLDDQ